MGFLTDLFAGGASDLVNSVGNVLDKVVTTKGETQQLDNELKKAEFNYQLEDHKLDVQEEAQTLADVGSARTMNANIESSDKASWLSKNIVPGMAIVTTVLTFTMFYILIFRKDLIDVNSKEIVLYVLGVLSTILVQVYSFYFGSSQGSSEKSKVIADLAKQ